MGDAVKIFPMSLALSTLLISQWAQSAVFYCSLAVNYSMLPNNNATAYFREPTGTFSENLNEETCAQQFFFQTDQNFLATQCAMVRRAHSSIDSHHRAYMSVRSKSSYSLSIASPHTLAAVYTLRVNVVGATMSFSQLAEVSRFIYSQIDSVEFVPSLPVKGWSGSASISSLEPRLPYQGLEPSLAYQGTVSFGDGVSCSSVRLPQVPSGPALDMGTVASVNETSVAVNDSLTPNSRYTPGIAGSISGSGVRSN